MKENLVTEKIFFSKWQKEIGKWAIIFKRVTKCVCVIFKNIYRYEYFNNLSRSQGIFFLRRSVYLLKNVKMIRRKAAGAAQICKTGDKRSVLSYTVRWSCESTCQAGLRLAPPASSEPPKFQCF